MSRSQNVKIFSLNVHSWLNPDRDPLKLIDHSVYEMAKKLEPDISCFQEVKHPHPAEPAKAENVVRITANDRTLFRYGNDETDEEIKKRLIIPPEYTFSFEEEQFMNDKDFRNKKRYLDFAFPYESKITCQPSLTSLMKIAQGMGATTEHAHFTPPSTHNPTFGNSIICMANRGTVEAKVMKVGKRTELRAATKIILDVAGHNWDFAVINLHLDHMREEARIEQMEQLLAWLKEKEGSYLPHALVGDFNAVSYWTEEVMASRLKCNLQPSTDELFKFLSETHGYRDLEKTVPPRTTSIYDVRVDYIFCSPMMLPRVDREKTRFDVLESESDHSAMFGNLVLRSDKLAIGVMGSEQVEVDAFAAELKGLMVDTGLGETELVQDIATLPERFSEVTNVIVVGNIKDVLPSLDLVFHLDDIDVETINERHRRKVVKVSTPQDALGHINMYLH